MIGAGRRDGSGFSHWSGPGSIDPTRVPRHGRPAHDRPEPGRPATRGRRGKTRLTFRLTRNRRGRQRFAARVCESRSSGSNLFHSATVPPR